MIRLSLEVVAFINSALTLQSTLTFNLSGARRPNKPAGLACEQTFRKLHASAVALSRIKCCDAFVTCWATVFVCDASFEYHFTGVF